jgi:hypothetical protein
VELHTWAGIRTGALADWPTVGMIAQVLAEIQCD